ncbi:hypothetical protein KF840_25210 [bacterium]|nr:hypothetical protein [bacterium]
MGAILTGIFTAPAYAALTNPSFETGTLTGWASIGPVSVVTSAYGSGPTAGIYQALLTSGTGSATDAALESFMGVAAGTLDGLGNGNATEGAALKQSFTAGAGAVISFDWNFLTNEATPTTYNDFAFVSISGVTSELADTNATFVISPTPFNEETGFHTFAYVIPSAGTYTISVGVTDINDAIVDSGLLVDNFSSPCGDGILDFGEQCDDGNVADGDCCSATCQYETAGSACGADGEPCTADVCDGAGTCVHPAGNGGATCRAAAGACDIAELCDGTTPTCPADQLVGSGISCRAAADLCDAEELCDGASPLCPADDVLVAGTPCRVVAGVCDLADACDGSSPACPADLKSTAECRASAGDCDVAESCDGVTDDCPADAFASIGTPCRAAASDCDVAESCTGSAPSCPIDAKQPDGTGCDDGNTCTQADACQTGACVGTDPLDCDDGNGCTADSCDPVGGCVNDDAPASGCLTPGTSLVLMKNASDDGKDKLLWKWAKGAALDPLDLADPISGSGYALCIYAGTAHALIADAAIPPGPSWSAVGTKGYKFKGSSPDGLSLALLKGGSAGKSKALAKGKGSALPDPTLPLAYPVTVQLKKAGAALCLESVFTGADEKKNTAAQFKAKR